MALPDLPLAWVALLEAGVRTGVKDIRSQPGCFEIRIDDNWWVAINPHDVATECSRKAMVLPRSAYIEWSGWPAGTVDPGGGVIAAGSGANEDAFIEACRAFRVGPAPGAAPVMRAPCPTSTFDKQAKPDA